MIIDFQAAKSKLNIFIDAYLRSKIKEKAPFLASLKHSQIKEGDKSYYETEQRINKEIKLQSASGDFSITNAEIKTITLEEILIKVDAVADSMARQMEGGLFKETFEAIEKVGNIIAGNPKLSSEAILQGLEKVQVNFIDDDRSKPHNHTIVAHPNAIRQLLEEGKNQTQEEKLDFERRREVILDKKYEEYMEREGKRKLVD